MHQWLCLHFKKGKKNIQNYNTELKYVRIGKNICNYNM
jgi:hypothetical protein